jgi:hypothetical protein
MMKEGTENQLSAAPAGGRPAAGSVSQHPDTTCDRMNSADDSRTVNNVMRHEYRVLTDEEKRFMERIKNIGADFYLLLAGIGQSRELSLAKTKIEEAVMWAVKHITR